LAKIVSLTDLYDAFGINYATEHSQVTAGWVGVNCPFCTGSPGFHLGAHLGSWSFSCWRCGKHTTVESFVSLLGVTEARARSLIHQYKDGGVSTPDQTKANRHVQIHPFKFPSYTDRLGSAHRSYLNRRGFDPDKLEREYDLVGTGPISMLDGLSYRFRIIAPIIWDKRPVSFQSRDYTGRAERKYLVCVPGREVIPQKSILYGKQEAWGDIGICVEGVTDVWRLGPQSFATLGIEYTSDQVLKMVDTFKRVIVLFDPETQAQRQARKLVAQLQACGTDAVIERLTNTDPGDMHQDDADHLVRTLLRKVY
jgi:5S rRNA maturation endonuclease (ribonuclease M5)